MNIKLEDGLIDENLRPLKVNGVKTAIETSTTVARASGDLEVNNDLEVKGNI